MYYFGVLMIIFAVCVFLTGLYAFTGHEIGILTWRVAFRNLNKEQWINIGKWTMISSIFILLIGIIGIIIK